MNEENIPPAVAAHLAEVRQLIAGLESDLADNRRRIERDEASLAAWRSAETAILRTVELMQADGATTSLGVGFLAGEQAAKAPRQRHDLREVVLTILRRTLGIDGLTLNQLVNEAAGELNRRVRPSEIQHAIDRLGSQIHPTGGGWAIGAYASPAPAEDSGK